MLSIEQKKILKSWLGTNGDGKYELCWSSAIHGSTASAFHRLCDGKSPTISLIKINENRVVGRFTDTAWRSKKI